MGQKTPSELLHEALEDGASAADSWPASVRSAICTREIFDPRPDAPADLEDRVQQAICKVREPRTRMVPAAQRDALAKQLREIRRMLTDALGPLPTDHPHMIAEARRRLCDLGALP
jgi:hypothetical protein